MVFTERFYYVFYFSAASLALSIMIAGCSGSINAHANMPQCQTRRTATVEVDGVPTETIVKVVVPGECDVIIGATIMLPLCIVALVTVLVIAIMCVYPVSTESNPSTISRDSRMCAFISAAVPLLLSTGPIAGAYFSIIHPNILVKWFCGGISIGFAILFLSISTGLILLIITARDDTPKPPPKDESFSRPVVTAV